MSVFKNAQRRFFIALGVFAVALGMMFVGAPAAFAASVDVVPPVYTPATCVTVGSVSAPATAEYTWTITG